jgi:RNA polymerase sigma-70 factor (ECF subfamily)
MDNSDPQPTSPATAVGAQPSAWVSTEFEAIYREHSRAIFYTALRLLGDPTLAEDATHDVFLRAFRHITDFRGQSSWRTWLYRITINHCLNLRQSWHSRHIVSDGNEQYDECAAAHSDPLQALETKELGLRIQKALDAVSDEYRLLLLLVADEKLSYDEIGELTGQTADAVRGKLHRARKAFLHEFKKSA